MWFRVLVLSVSVLCSAAVSARQEPISVRRAVETYLQTQTKGLPGRVSVVVGDFDPNNQLTPCSALEAGLPPGSRPWGRVHVQVRCLDDPGWSVYVSAQVKVFADYVVAASPIVQGQVIAQAHLAYRQGDLAILPPGVITDPGEALGRVSMHSIAAGQLLRSDMLKQPAAVQQNQMVRVVSRGAGFQVTNEGRALNNATAGQVVQVRLANGQIVSGIARSNGQVEINPQ